MPAMLVVFLVILLEVLCLGAVYPVISFYGQQLGGGPAVIGLLWALMSAPKVVMTPIWGRLSDRFGRKPLLVTATIGTLSGSLLWALAPRLGGMMSLYWLVVSRAVTGTFGAHAGLGQAVAADVSPPEKRAAAMGLMGAAFGLGITFGPVVGALVAARWSHADVGFVCVAFEAISMLIIFLFLPETRPEQPPEARLRADRSTRWRTLIRAPGVGRFLLVTFVMTLGFAHISATFPLLAQRWYTFGVRQTGGAFALLGIIGVAVQGGGIRLIVPRYGEGPTVVAGLIALAAGFGLLAMHPGTGPFWVALVLIGLGSALSMPPLIGLLSKCVGPEAQGSVMGLNQSVTGLGRAISAGLGGKVFDAFGPVIPYAGGTGLLVLSLILFVGKKEHAGSASGRPVEV